MASEHPSDVKFEIGHVLFIDIVGYSKLLIHEQLEYLEKLREVARATETFRMAQREGKLMRLPTGDGGALVFGTSPEAPVKCAMEIARELKKHPELRVRMGIHSGPVKGVTDLSEQGNIAGAGINIAQRVMDCGDAGHILVSKRVADDLEQYAQWRPLLHDLGTCEVKHGVSLALFNLYSDAFGNAAMPKKFTQDRQLRAVGGDIERPLAPKKSIAVLPFENLSDDKSNAYFADGIQEEILTRLAKVADLRVIARTSTERYKSSPENLPQIAQQLGVAHILEGSVQKAAEKVRVSVQLISASTQAHLWAETYDRNLTDIFAVESDIAKTIADTLQAKLSDPEQHAITARPTENAEAYQLYLKGRYFWNKRTGADLKTAIDYFHQAIGIDTNYALAYAGLADAYGLLSGFGAASPKDSMPQAKAAAKKALELDNTLGEAHASLAQALFAHDFNFAAA